MDGQSKNRAGKRGIVAKLIGLDLTLAVVIVGGISLLSATTAKYLTGIYLWLNNSAAIHFDALQTAILLNIALLLVGWRRYRDLSREVQERTEAEERANRLALRDALTGLLNRRALIENGQALLDATMAEGKQLAVAMIDLDHFKTINDIHGHATGDAFLRRAAATLVDTLPAGAMIARLGGDEFAFLMPFDSGQRGHLDALADKLLQKLSRPIEVEATVLQATASIGLAPSGTDTNSLIESLVRRADIAMYRAKSEGRSRFCWFDESMERLLQERNRIENDIRAGIPRSEFIPYFEQQIDLNSGKVTGFEVLARWNHPTDGLVPPDVFIGIAEETGLIADISMQVTHKALEVARDWDSDITISINISPAQLRDPWLAQKIVKLLLETGFPASRFEIEITETALFDNIVLAKSIIMSLKNQGMRVALDDFGTGYSSLAHLRALPFDRLKIDRSFVTSMLQDNESAAIVQAITGLGENLNLTITAEGIEDGAIAERLRPLGIDKGQGWHFGKPMSAEDASALLDKGGYAVMVQPDKRRKAA